jgi:hypothetical protein
MAMFKQVTNYNYTNNPSQFIIELRETIYKNLLKYKSTIDVMNFQEIFEDYNKLIKSYSKKIGRFEMPSFNSEEKDNLNYPLIMKNNNLKHNRHVSLDNYLDKRKLQREPQLKSYFDKPNTKEIAENINNKFDKNNMTISKESLNISNISNVFEKHSNYKEVNFTKDKFVKEFSFDKDEENGQDKHFNTLERQMYSIDGLESSPQFLDN